MENNMTSEVIEWFSLAERMDNDEQYIQEAVTRWFDDYSAIIKLLANSVHSQNADDIFMYAHKIRGSSAIFGMKLLSDAAGMLEDAGAERNFEKAEEHFLCVKKEFEKARAFVTKPDWVELAKQQSEANEKF
jgi:HPt (histidine-containing phosphotransfer) domain-containing protein